MKDKKSKNHLIVKNVIVNMYAVAASEKCVTVKIPRPTGTPFDKGGW